MQNGQVLNSFKCLIGDRIFTSVQVQVMFNLSLHLLFEVSYNLSCLGFQRVLSIFLIPLLPAWFPQTCLWHFLWLMLSVSYCKLITSSCSHSNQQFLALLQVALSDSRFSLAGFFLYLMSAAHFAIIDRLHLSDVCFKLVCVLPFLLPICYYYCFQNCAMDRTPPFLCILILFDWEHLGKPFHEFLVPIWEGCAANFDAGMTFLFGPIELPLLQFDPGDDKRMIRVSTVLCSSVTITDVGITPGNVQVQVIPVIWVLGVSRTLYGVVCSGKMCWHIQVVVAAKLQQSLSILIHFTNAMAS